MLKFGFLIIVFLSAATINAHDAQAAKRDCRHGESAATLYERFVSYRKAINSARAPQDLAPFFTPAFNRYFQSQLDGAQSDAEKNRVLNQYWDNLNNAADIVSVYQYDIVCFPDKTRLLLLASLKSDMPKIGGTIAVWRIDVEYKQQQHNWLIDNIEFNKLKKIPRHLRLLNNFSVIP